MPPTKEKRKKRESVAQWAIRNAAALRKKQGGLTELDGLLYKILMQRMIGELVKFNTYLLRNGYRTAHKRFQKVLQIIPAPPPPHHSKEKRK